MHESSGDFPSDIGEPDYLGFKLAPSGKIAVPRVADAPFAMECKTWKTIEVNGDRVLIMGEGINFFIRDELWDPGKMRVHVDRYHPIGRMFADRYCRTDDRVIFRAAEGVRSA
jgi:flavin reductase (DIM6/NTAB) family NADH-FMN oxidoreductase RutF